MRRVLLVVLLTLATISAVRAEVRVDGRVQSNQGFMLSTTAGSQDFNTTILYFGVSGAAAFAGFDEAFATESLRVDWSPFAMVCRDLHVCGSADLLANEQLTFTLRDDSADTSLTCVVDTTASGSACTGDTKRSCRDLTNAVSIAADSLLSYSVVCAGAGCPVTSTGFKVSMNCRRRPAPIE